MAQNSDLTTRVCVVWLADKPYVDKVQKSSNFSLLGSEWHLQMKYASRTSGNYLVYYYTLSLHQDTKTENLQESSQFRVSVFLENGNFDLTTIVTSRKVQSTHDILWDCQKCNITNYIPDFDNYATFNVICLFRDVPPSALRIKEETIHLTTQNAFDLPAEIDLLPDLKSLSHDLSSLLKNEVFPDVKLRCGGRTFSAHSCILAARSEVFAAMFRSEMIESETRIIDIRDVDADVLDLLLKYVYSGKLLDVSEDTARGLYTAGDKYAIQALKKASADWMIRGLTEENCARFLTIADLHNDVAFKRAVFSFIKRL